MQTNDVLAVGAFFGAAFLGFALFDGLRKGELFLLPQCQPKRATAPILFWLCCGTLGVVGLATFLAGVSLLLGFD